MSVTGSVSIEAGESRIDGVLIVRGSGAGAVAAATQYLASQGISGGRHILEGDFATRGATRVFVLVSVTALVSLRKAPVRKKAAKKLIKPKKSAANATTARKK